LKITDKIHRYSISERAIDGLCRLRVFCNDNNEIVALVTSVGNMNTGKSITNAIEYVIGGLVDSGDLPVETIFIEHYEKDYLGKDSFTLVKLNQNGSPAWKGIAEGKAIELLSCTKAEFSEPTLNNERLLNDLAVLNRNILPARDYDYSEFNDKLKRYIEIEKESISKRSILDLIEKGAKETAFLKLLGEDLSVFGEVHAHPEDDYIVFPEFPIGDGFVDFLILTSVSYMDVVLVEIKGADFNMFNQGHYDKPARNIEIACDQIRKRLRYIMDDLASFRKHIHNIRERVEAGESIHNSFIGPSDHLEVSSDKDIRIHTVVIGGRTVNDIEEAKKRHEYTSNQKMNLRLESWDTWVRKLKRD